jgi:hypothetical protein
MIKLLFEVRRPTSQVFMIFWKKAILAYKTCQSKKTPTPILLETAVH